MLEKWYLQPTATSKGFFYGWNDINLYILKREIYDICNTNSTPSKVLRSLTKPKPSFRKEIANAESYNTKEEAEAELAKYYDEANKKIEQYKIDIDAIQKMISSGTWPILSDDTRKDFYITHSLDVNGVSFYFGNKRANSIYYSDISESKDLSIIKGLDLNKCLLYKQVLLEAEEARVKYLDKNIKVVKLDFEFKFMPKERRIIRWTMRGESQTNNQYCAGCGGAIPNIPQLVIGKKEKQHYSKDPVYICAICVEKLAEEAKRQAGKIPQDILDHYHQDRFLRELG